MSESEETIGIRGICCLISGDWISLSGSIDRFISGAIALSLSLSVHSFFLIEYFGDFELDLPFSRCI